MRFKFLQKVLITVHNSKYATVSRAYDTGIYIEKKDFKNIIKMNYLFKMSKDRLRCTNFYPLGTRA